MELTFDHQLLSKSNFALVDLAMADYLPTGVEMVSVVPPTMASSAHLMPHLVDLNAMHEDVRAALLTSLFEAQQDREQPAITMLIQTSMNGNDLVRYWNTLQLATPTPAQKVWLRLHDPRVLHQLLRILTAAQRKRLFGQIESFTYWLGDDWVHAAAHAATAYGADAAARPRWDWPRIEQIGVVNRALQGAGIVQASSITRQSELAEQLIARARQQYDLSEQADLVEFAARGLMTSPTFDDHPELRRAIRHGSYPEDDATLADRLALIDDEVWASVCPPNGKEKNP